MDVTTGTYPYYFENQTGEEVPAWGLVRIEGAVRVSGTKRLKHTALLPTGQAGESWIVNGPIRVLEGRSGHGTIGPFVWVRYEGDAPAAGDEWGPAAGSFGIESSGSGWLVHEVDEDNQRAWCSVLATTGTAGDGGSGYPPGTGNCGCKKQSRQFASVTSSDCESIEGTEAAFDTYVVTLPHDVLAGAAQFGGEHELHHAGGCAWESDEFKLFCVPDDGTTTTTTGTTDTTATTTETTGSTAGDEGLIEEPYILRMTLTTDTIAGVTVTTARLELVYNGEGESECGYEFVAVCRLFDPLGSNRFEIVRAACLQFTACAVCVKANSGAGSLPTVGCSVPEITKVIEDFWALVNLSGWPTGPLVSDTETQGCNATDPPIFTSDPLTEPFTNMNGTWPAVVMIDANTLRVPRYTLTKPYPFLLHGASGDGCIICDGPGTAHDNSVTYPEAPSCERPFIELELRFACVGSYPDLGIGFELLIGANLHWADLEDVKYEATIPLDELEVGATVTLNLTTFGMFPSGTWGEKYDTPETVTITLMSGGVDLADTDKDGRPNIWPCHGAADDDWPTTTSTGTTGTTSTSGTTTTTGTTTTSGTTTTTFTTTTSETTTTSGEVVEGACCQTETSVGISICGPLPEEDCIANGGSYLGDNTDCDPTPCCACPDAPTCAGKFEGWWEWSCEGGDVWINHGGGGLCDNPGPPPASVGTCPGSPTIYWRCDTCEWTSIPP